MCIMLHSGVLRPSTMVISFEPLWLHCFVHNCTYIIQCYYCYEVFYAISLKNFTVYDYADFICVKFVSHT
jgi:hypothetical protein